ncbi:acidic repeat-containing protein-like isoform X3 [Stylophora pistillata]|uniref:acidic repeat-containing protein-like isoform X3 n=1 Tax=Stylophora pistillata TaxID=50429 RepID=UPI000C04183F|nr:acidic repeat-containing protein-like isoform X3 [Stylophora pistillata]
MEVYSKKSVEERLLKMGKKFGWFDQPNLGAKIEELVKLSNGIITNTKSIVLVNDCRKEINEEENDTGSVIIYSNDTKDVGNHFAICDVVLGDASNENQESSTDSQHCAEIYFSENNDLMTGTRGKSLERDSLGSNMAELCIEDGLETVNSTESTEASKVEDSCFYNNREESSIDNDDDEGNTDITDDDHDETKNRNDDEFDADDSANGCNQNDNDIIEVKSPIITEEGFSSALDNSLEISDSCSRNSSGELIRSKSSEDVQCNGLEEEQAEMFNFETDDDSNGAVSIDLTRTTPRSNINNNFEDINQANSPVKIIDCEVSKLQEFSSLDNTDSYCSDSQDGDKDHRCLNKSNDDKCDDDDDRDLLDSKIKQNLVMSSSFDFDRKSDDDSNDDDNDEEMYISIESIKAKTSMGASNCCVEVTSPVKASLSERLFEKYNPEKSTSDDVDDFEQFLQNIRTPKQSELSAKERKTESSLNMFIVDDDEDDDVFCDPGFTPEPDKSFDDDDKENEHYLELATPVTGNARSKTPLTSLSWGAAINSTPYRPSFQTPLTDFSWRTHKTKPRYDSGMPPAKPSRPKSVLENVLTSYTTEKDFKKNKEKLVRDLFELYNQTVFDNQLPSDFQITWNPRMRSTAGFCYYSRKSSLRVARIELADKVIDSADRLRDTLIHEMCHAAAWLISGVKAGHGPVWKKWTLRANHVHQDLPPISRCHSYTINAKYTYRCTNCGNTFGRHSKSVNLEKSRCAYCHSRLELVPQLKKDGTPQIRTPSRFALFVKENYARIKGDHETFSHQDVMKALSSEFSELSTK